MVRRARYIPVLGVVLIGIAAGQSLLKVAGGGSGFEALIDFLLLGLTGALFLYVGHWLTSSTVNAELYPRIAAWSLGGVAVMLAFLLLRAVHPGVPYEFSFGTRAAALAIGSIAGLGIGIHETQAISRERELERQNAELGRVQRLLEQRNDELERTQTELEAAVRQLKASNERLDQFASAASHDLQEPLRMISNYLQLIEDRYDDDLDEDGREFIAYAVDGADRMQAMIDGLLRYSRIETRGDPLEPVELGDVVGDVLSDIQLRVAETGTAVSVGELPRVEGDENQLRQLLQNLLINAIEYSGESPPRIDVTAERTGDVWEIGVNDDGIGIAPDDQKRIFEVFDRLHGQGEHEGTGIGLALCQRIVERHGGEIRVDSALGAGSTFSFTLRPA